jgi:hypothetical protein
MRLFECQHCGQPLYFENTRCESCGRWLGYLPSKEDLTALEPDNGGARKIQRRTEYKQPGEIWRALAAPEARYRYCANAEYETCNWLVDAEGLDIYCAACRHNRTIPNLSIPDNVAHWRKIEIAKHRLFYTLLKLKLPLTTRPRDPNGLAFDFLAEPPPGSAGIVTGHFGGVITINVAEADDAERERQRRSMGEPYRTLLGHFRHEIAHYYWDRLVSDTPAINDFHRIFGDERRNYSEALQQHYANGPPSDWAEHFVTAYASAHPWEDFAETWAHYFHMLDTLETASVFGLRVRPKLTKGAALATVIDFDPHAADLNRIIDAWLPLTFAINSINRSMGLADLYPFVLPPPVIVKLSFIHNCIHARSGRQEISEVPTLKAIIAGLRRRVGLPA